MHRIELSLGRMMASLDHCVIAVSQWERSNTFYADVLGEKSSLSAPRTSA